MLTEMLLSLLLMGFSGQAKYGETPYLRAVGRENAAAIRQLIAEREHRKEIHQMAERLRELREKGK